MLAAPIHGTDSMCIIGDIGKRYLCTEDLG